MAWKPRDQTESRYIDIEMPDIGLLEFETVRPIVEQGYLAGVSAVDGWLEAPVSDRE